MYRDMKANITNEIKRDMYVIMLRNREFEERAIAEYRKGNIPGFIHSSIGEEALFSFLPFSNEI